MNESINQIRAAFDSGVTDYVFLIHWAGAGFESLDRACQLDDSQIL